MVSWAKYAVSFFALVLILSAVVVFFGPYRSHVEAPGKNIIGTVPAEKGGKAGR